MVDEGNGRDIRTDLRKYPAFSALTDQDPRPNGSGRRQRQPREAAPNHPDINSLKRIVNLAPFAMRQDGIQLYLIFKRTAERNHNPPGAGESDEKQSESTDFGIDRKTRFG